MTRYICSECDKPLTTEELLERWCTHCRKDIQPRERKTERRAA